MTKYTARVLALAALLGGCASIASAQTPTPSAAPAQPPSPQAASATAQTTADKTASGGAPTICGQQVPAPATLPPAGSGPVLYLIAVCFPAQGNASTVDAQTYLYYMELFKQRSQPTQNIWTPWSEATEQIAVADHKRLWATGFLSDLSI